MLALQPPHVPRDRRQLPGRDLQPRQDFAGARMAQAFDVLVGHAAEAKAVGDAIHMALEPGKAVGERAVEIEDNKGIGQETGHER